jgi:hypothetical protein
MKGLFFAIFSLAFLLLGQAQVLAQRSESEQSKFAAEENPDEPRVRNPIPVPDVVVEALKTEETVKSCLQYNPLEPGQTLSSWFIASAIHLDGPKESDVVVVPSFSGQESMCFQSASGVGLFWIFRKNSERYELVLKTYGNGLEILKSKTNGYRNIRTGTIGEAGKELTELVFHFDGTHYVESEESTHEQQ